MRLKRDDLMIPKPSTIAGTDEVAHAFGEARTLLDHFEFIVQCEAEAAFDP